MSSFFSRLRHDLVVERYALTQAGEPPATSFDDYNLPVREWPATDPEVEAVGRTPTIGHVAPKSSQEMAALHDAGAVVADYTIFLPQLDVRAADRIRFEPDDGRRFEVRAVRDAAGVGHHLEVDAQLVTP